MLAYLVYHQANTPNSSRSILTVGNFILGLASREFLTTRRDVFLLS